MCRATPLTCFDFNLVFSSLSTSNLSTLNHQNQARRKIASAPRLRLHQPREENPRMDAICDTAAETNEAAQPTLLSFDEMPEWFRRELTNGSSMAIDPFHKLNSDVVPQLVLHSQRISQHLLPPYPGRHISVRRVLCSTIPHQQTLEGHRSRLPGLLHLHIGGSDVLVALCNVPHFDEPLSAHGTSLPAAGHARCRDFHLGRPRLGNLHGFLA